MNSESWGEWSLIVGFFQDIVLFSFIKEISTSVFRVKSNIKKFYIKISNRSSIKS